MKCFQCEKPATHILRIENNGQYTVYIELAASADCLSDAEDVIKRSQGVAEEDLVETLIPGLQRLRIPETDKNWRRLYDPVSRKAEIQDKLMANAPPDDILDALPQDVADTIRSRLPER